MEIPLNSIFRMNSDILFPIGVEYLSKTEYRY